MAEKKYSDRTKRVLKHTREQTAHAQELAGLREYFATQARGLEEEMFAPPDAAGRRDLLPGYWNNVDEWNEKFDRELEFKEAAEEAPFNMLALLQAAVRELGMPKRKPKKTARGR